jgi:hypothetical protein
MEIGAWRWSSRESADPDATGTFVDRANGQWVRVGDRNGFLNCVVNDRHEASEEAPTLWDRLKYDADTISQTYAGYRRDDNIDVDFQYAIALNDNLQLLVLLVSATSDDVPDDVLQRNPLPDSVLWTYRL